MLDHDRGPPPSYFARREAQERANAERAADPTVKRLHLDFAERYAALIRADDEAPALA